ncbi:N-acetylmuramoyl-L-alanine amidase [Bacteroidales bacterium OttesenSCG-928-C19]|nr:N-acetylmuramoyl-L-alanine amidase [Bacteroidales bacterium OttesenSCG-928-C19]
MKKIVLITLLLLGFVGVNAQGQKKLKTIVIDAGHGGDKPGAVGKKSMEKDITLAVALKFGEAIKKNFSDVNVIYTRTTDVDVNLSKRSQIANKANADLFVSIHVNSSTNKDATGFETFVMGLSKSSANLDVAIKENKDMLKEDDYANNPEYQGFDPSSPESYIMFALYQNAYLYNSLEFASALQNQYKGKIKSVNRGVKQAEFFVLYKTATPAVLTEIGFISNEKEEQYLNSKEGQETIVASLFNAFNEYKALIEGTEPVKNPSLDTKDYLVKRDSVPQKEEKKKETTQPKKEEVAKVEPKKEAPKVEVKKVPEGPVVEYRVQFLVSKTKLELTDKKFKDLESVQMYEYDGLYRYTIGNENTISSARSLVDMLKNKNYKDAFIVAFYENKRVSLQEAQKLPHIE